MMKSDVEIAQEAKIAPIIEVAKKLVIDDQALEFYGRYQAKINVDKTQFTSPGKLVLVSGMTPTKAGEGKSTITIGLVDGLNAIGHLSCGV